MKKNEYMRRGMAAIEVFVLLCVFALIASLLVTLESPPGLAPRLPSGAPRAAMVAASMPAASAHLPTSAPAHLLTALPALPGPAAGSTDFRRYLATNSNQTAFSLTAGWKSFSDLSSFTVASMGAPNADRRRGLRVVFFGPGDNNDTFTYRVWVLRGVSARGAPGQPGAFLMRLLGAGSCTLGTSVGVASGEVLDTERFVDTLTYTPTTTGTSPTGPGTSIETAFSPSVVYSPADNTIAELILPDLGNEGYYVIEFNNASDANCRPNALVADDF